MPRIILQEFFGQTVTPNSQLILSLKVIFIALVATFAWQAL
jgi:hypothetical protein